MKFEVTQRDKFLLKVMAVFVIVAFFVFLLIKPMMSKISDMDTQIEDLKFQKSSMEMQIASLENNQTTNDELSASLALMQSDFYPVILSQQIDREITNLILQCKLEALNMDISMPSDAMTLSPYIYSGAALSMKGEDGNYPQLGHFLEGKLSMTVSGEKAGIWTLIDTLNMWQPKVRTTSFSMTPKMDGAEPTGAYTANISLSFYMFSPIEMTNDDDKQ